MRETSTASNKASRAQKSRSTLPPEETGEMPLSEAIARLEDLIPAIRPRAEAAALKQVLQDARALSRAIARNPQFHFHDQRGVLTPEPAASPMLRDTIILLESETAPPPGKSKTKRAGARQ